jgi:hypothetical protein
MGRQTGDVPAFEKDLSAIRPEDAGETVDEGGLAGAVGADERRHLAALRRKMHLFQSGQAPEIFAQARDPDQGNFGIRHVKQPHAQATGAPKEKSGSYGVRPFSNDGAAFPAARRRRAACVRKISTRPVMKPWGKKRRISTRMSP